LHEYLELRTLFYNLIGHISSLYLIVGLICKAMMTKKALKEKYNFEANI